ncbi:MULTISPECIES: DNA alkylation repair protein [Chryseobacterium]|uniref:3-methyladenine DNA glycosylase AlkD n=1 Tax=Chryseobacterium camelliae TaxID=1265445 RepID=A0ABU0TM34_9FLAO|nr:MULTISPECIES: DNA alkylation repair protein [Chryseobacterium]MDT3408034.1 3-methyladenine DNA glycosylase AlkD [Pseudacidovorax intermedius]MDQ1098111.1 3-methyladenine DNA glycosylase AlkD [Chryseobacterium camelliae]MDQ1102041.1 3-methyladenine DNA glycosylase AlkD [Chryseobacterium sp. SORGH_AS_1048]MDR6085477.1 3-methyladenine DNA glycosylase AlkD [Chryseobacterium sp. SORGH_AS_0909]MDR6129841.1 3-methyladenine DNA glycosylase AlkD [Chryseobacterium sp. SORGH_AS_1175]
MSSVVTDIREALAALAVPGKALDYQKFFKTGIGEYSEGDVFLGISVPDQRAVAKAFYLNISLDEISLLLSSDYHEHRLTALLMMVNRFRKAKSQAEKNEIVDLYLSHLQYVNNWDLADSSSYTILGCYAYEYDRADLLRSLALSDPMWHKRIAVVATLYHIKKHSFELTKELVSNNLEHPHDLMHKANGWMLREMGKKAPDDLIRYLNRHYQDMPRTCLRYAIEKLDEPLRQKYLKGQI